MTKKVLFAGAILLAVALVAVAADNITGKWTYDAPAGRGGGGGGGGAAAGATPRVVTLDLKVDGMTLSGTVLQPAFGGRGGGGGGGGAMPAPTPTPISNAKVNGDSFSFEVSTPGRNGGDPRVTKYEGKAAGGQLNLKVTNPGRQGGDPVTTEVVAKKATT